MLRKSVISSLIFAAAMFAPSLCAQTVLPGNIQVIVDSKALVDINITTVSHADTVVVTEVVEPVEIVEVCETAEVLPAQESSRNVSQKPVDWSPRPKFGPDGINFVWGAEVGSTIDMSGSEMSSIDFNAAFGLGYKWLNFAGIGAGAHIMVSNSCRTYPIFALIRSDFSKLVKFLFVDFRAGVALNYLEPSIRQTGVYLSPSLGFNLATGEKFRSYITVGYTYISRKDAMRGDTLYEFKPLSMASVRLGVAF